MKKKRRQYHNVRNVDQSLMSKDILPMSVTRALMGRTPLVSFKGGYKKSVKLTAPQLRERIAKVQSKGSDRKLAPYLYDAHRRGMDLPVRTTDRYKPVDEDYVNDISNISGRASGRYIGTIMAATGAGTGASALDYLQDIMSRKSPAHKEGFKIIEEGASKAIGRIGKGKAGRMAANLLTKSTTELLGGKNPKRKGLVGSVMGAVGSAPAAAFATIPLLSPTVTSKLKGKDKESKRYKTFDWIERNPEATVGAAFAPMVGSRLYGGYKDLARVVAQNKGGSLTKMVKPLGSSLARSGLTLGKVGLGAVAPVAYMTMRRYMQRARDQERQLQEQKLRKPIEGTEA